MTDLQSFTLMMASTQVVETSVNTNNSPSQDYTTNPDDHSNHNIDSPGFKSFTVIYNNYLFLIVIEDLNARQTLRSYCTENIEKTNTWENINVY